MAGVSAPVRCGTTQPGCWQRKQLHSRSQALFLCSLNKKERKEEQACLHGAGSALVQNNPVDLSGWLLENDPALLDTRRKRKGFFFFMCV